MSTLRAACCHAHQPPWEQGRALPTHSHLGELEENHSSHPLLLRCSATSLSPGSLAPGQGLWKADRQASQLTARPRTTMTPGQSVRSTQVPLGSQTGFSPSLSALFP